MRHDEGNSIGGVAGHDGGGSFMQRSMIKSETNAGHCYLKQMSII